MPHWKDAYLNRTYPYGPASYHLGQRQPSGYLQTLIDAGMAAAATIDFSDSGNDGGRGRGRGRGQMHDSGQGRVRDRVSGSGRASGSVSRRPAQPGIRIGSPPPTSSQRRSVTPQKRAGEELSADYVQLSHYYYGGDVGASSSTPYQHQPVFSSSFF